MIYEGFTKTEDAGDYGWGGTLARWPTDQLDSREDRAMAPTFGNQACDPYCEDESVDPEEDGKLEDSEEHWEIFAYLTGQGLNHQDKTLDMEEAWHDRFYGHVESSLLSFGDGILPAGGYSVGGGLSPGWKREPVNGLGKHVIWREIITRDLE